VNTSLKLKVGKATVNFIANTLITTRWDSIVDEYKTTAYNQCLRAVSIQLAK